MMTFWRNGKAMMMLVVIFALPINAAMSNSIWGGLVEVKESSTCSKINISGHKFCLPKDRILVWRTGEHAAMLRFYSTYLLKGENILLGREVRLNLNNAHTIRSTPRGRTLPEHNMLYHRKLFKGATSEEKKMISDKLQKMVNDDSNNNVILDVTDLLENRVSKRRRYIVSRNKRVTHLFSCTELTHTKDGLLPSTKSSCHLDFQDPQSVIAVGFFGIIKIKDNMRLVKRMIAVNDEFWKLLMASAE